IRDQKRILPACAYLEGQYGHKDIYLGVPAKLGKDGVEEIIQLTLSDDEQTMLDRSAEAVKEGISKLEL
ncbi:MAG: malate dehydrogenase, partial [ANME-2 cluster archaeon]